MLEGVAVGCCAFKQKGESAYSHPEKALELSAQMVYLGIFNIIMFFFEISYRVRLFFLSSVDRGSGSFFRGISESRQSTGF